MDLRKSKYVKLITKGNGVSLEEFPKGIFESKLIAIYFYVDDTPEKIAAIITNLC